MNRSSRQLVVSVGLGMLLNPLNSSMISIALFRLQHVYGLPFTAISWIVFSFYIASAVAQPVMGKASDVFGRKNIFLSGLVVAFAASLVAPLSPTFGWLLLFRIVQSIGTSMMISVGMALIRIHVTERQAAALSLTSIFLSGAAAVGPFLGGILLHWWDWPAIFLINIPLAVASFLFAWKAIPADERASAPALHLSLRGWMDKVDAVGVLLFSAGLVALLAGLLSMAADKRVSLAPCLAGLTGLVLLALFIRHESRTASPFVPLQVFAKHPAMAWIHIEFILVNLLFYSLFFGLPSYLQEVRQLGEFHTGALMLTLGLCSLAASPLAGRWIDKSGHRPALRVSAILMALGSLWMVTWNPASSLIGVGLVLAAFGISNALNSVGMQAALFQAAPKEIIGVASGLFMTSRYLGTILSSLLLGLTMGEEFSAGGFRLLGVLLSVIALCLVYLSWRRQTPGQREASSSSRSTLREV